MKRTPLLCLLSLAGAVSACSDSGEPPPPAKKETSFVNVAVNPRASWTTAAQRDQVTVLDDRLIFPAKGNEALLKKVAGDVLVSDRSLKGNNPYGYMRLVVSVAQQGDTIVVMTDHATLESVIAGQFEIVAQPTEFTAMTAQELGSKASDYPDAPRGLPGLRPQGESELSLTLGKTVEDYKLYELKGGQFKLPVGKYEMNAAIGTSAKIERASFEFTPSVRIGGDIQVPGGFFGKFNPANYVQEFHVITKGQLSAMLHLISSASVSIEIPNLAKLDKDNSSVLANLASSATDKLRSANPPSELRVPLLKLPFVGPPLPTPIGPIPITYEFEIELACGVQLSGGYEVDTGFSGSATAEFGARFEKDKGWTPISGFDFKHQAIGPNLRFNAGAELKCGLEPKLSTHLADAAGPYLKVGLSASAKAEYKEECPKGSENVPPTPSLNASLEANFDVGVGVDVQIPVIKYGLAQAQFNLYNKKLYEVKAPKVDLPQSWAWGWCIQGAPCTADDTPDKTPECAAGAGGSGQGGSGQGGNGSGATNQGGNGSGATNQGGNGSGASNSGGNGTGATSSGGNGSGTSGQGGSGQTAVCGNGKVDSAIEFCDGNDFDGKTCADYKGNPNATGALKCNQNCTIDTSSCDVGAVCGDVCTPAMTPQKPECGGCQQKVCEANEYCCNDKWDAVCVSVAKTLCGMCN